MDSDALKYIQQDQINNEPVTNMPPPLYTNASQLAVNVPATVQIGPAPNQQNTFRPVGPKSMEMVCPSCRCRIRTNIRHRSTAKTHIACLLLSPM